MTTTTNHPSTRAIKFFRPSRVGPYIPCLFLFGLTLTLAHLFPNLYSSWTTTTTTRSSSSSTVSARQRRVSRRVSFVLDQTNSPILLYIYSMRHTQQPSSCSVTHSSRRAYTNTPQHSNRRMPVSLTRSTFSAHTQTYDHTPP